MLHLITKSHLESFINSNYYLIDS